ncbi:MAG: G8 domain-containing protein, partial [Balneolales bacterium]|nr:G8 domain-containing protein [Balneolales bacterium]
MKHIPYLTFILLFFFASASVKAQSMQNVLDLVPVNEATHTATSSGDWETAATWGETFPGENAKIVIPNGITVTINSQLASEFEWIRISNGGKLTFNPSQTTLLKVETIVSGMSGEFEMGTAVNPIASNQTATIIFSGQQQAIDFGANDPGYLKRGAILMGKSTIHGEEKSSW